MSYSTEVLADTPLVYWKLDETSGPTAADSSGNARSGTYTSSPTIGATSLLADGSGHAMSIAANTGQSVRVSWGSWLNGLSSALSVECLVNITSAVDAGSGDALVCWFNTGTHFLLWRNGSGKAAFRVYLNNGLNYEAASSATLTGKHQVVGTWDGSTVKVYVDGSLAGSLATAASTLSTSAPDIVEIGTYAAASATTPDAVIDEVSIYDHALSATRVSDHFIASGVVQPPAITGTWGLVA